MQSNEVEEQFKVMRSGKSHLAMDEVGFEALFGGLLAVIANDVPVILAKLVGIKGEV